MTQRLCLFVWLMLFTSSLASSATLHVRTDGSDSTCNGSANASSASAPNCAYATINTAVGNWSGTGNTVLVHAGTYTAGATACAGTWTATICVQDTKNGASGAYNVIKAANDGTVTLGSGGSTELAVLVAASYVQIGGLGTGEGFTILGDYPATAHAYTGAGNRGEVFFNRASIGYDRAYGLNMLENTAAGIVSGDLGEGMIACYNTSCVGLDVQNNTIVLGGFNTGVAINHPGDAKCGATGGPCAGTCESDQIIRGNTITWDNGHGDPRKCGFCGENMNNPLYENNYVRITGGSGYGTSLRSFCNVTFRNNFIESTASQYVFYNFDQQNHTQQNWRVYNNTFYGSTTNPAVYMNDCDGCEVRNNLILGNAAGAFPEPLRSGGTGGSCSRSNPATSFQGYNAFYNTGGATYNTCPLVTYEGFNVTSNPQLTLSGGKPTPFFQIANGASPLVDAGFSGSSAPTTDYDGTNRTSIYDIGADEFGAGAADTTPPSAISNLVASTPILAPQLHMTLAWTAPGGNGSVGTATSYDVRYSTTGPLTEPGWAAATLVEGEPTPLISGTSQSFTPYGLKPNTTYYWAMKSTDGAGNVSGISSSGASTTLATATYHGYGSAVTGGGGQTIYHVTSLADTATTGTLRDALSTGNRYIVFDLGGTIPLGSTINFTGSNVTIDGSTAPSPGITVTAAAAVNDGIRWRDNTNTIATYLRIQGQTPDSTVCTSAEDSMTTNATVGNAVTSLVWDHLTVRNVADAAFDVWNKVTDATISYNHVLNNCHPQTSGGAAGSARMTWHHNLWASNGERMPQFVLSHDDMDIRNNIYYKWTNSYAIRIRNSSLEKVSANIVNNYFFAGTAATNAGLIYGSTPGQDAGEENGPATCQAQGTVVSTTLMGALWTAGNAFNTTNCDSYSTVSAERTVPVANQVTTDSSSALVNTILPYVGTQYRLTDEQALIDTVTADLGIAPTSIGQTLLGVIYNGVTPK